MKLALALICKGTDEEAKLLDRCLDDITSTSAVDAVYITSTYTDKPNEKITQVCAQYGANVSHFKWIDDFAAARNFNFSQVPKEYDYIMWCDADDVWQGSEKIKSLIQENQNVDAFAFWYYYEFDKYNNPTVVHKKTQIVRNDGCVEWIGRLHEDFKENRSLTVKFVEGIERIHLTSEKRGKENMERNVRISEKEATDNPNDPKVHFNLGNSYFGAGNLSDAKKVYDTFLATTQSDDEKYLILQRLSATENALNNRDKAVEYLLIAIGMFPELPDAYNNIGYLYFAYNNMDKAEKYLLMGLTMKPQYHKMIVYNPRDYDYNPMMALAKVYFNKARPDYALPLLKGCLQIYPKDEHIKDLVEKMEKELASLEDVIKLIKRIEVLPPKEILEEINKLPLDVQSNPAICRLRNLYDIKTLSSGKDIAYFCGETSFDWNPDLFKTKGFGGSEEAVVNLAKQWAKQGYNVTVYNSCGLESMTRDGVTYKPFWTYNPKDKFDYFILWRSPRLLDHDINATKVFVDLHDVISPGEFNKKRLEKITKVMVKTRAHRILFPNIPDDKIEIIPNGMDFDLFDSSIKKDPYLIVNTSSPDRSMDVLPKLFKKIKKRVPKAKLAWCYGWDNFDKAFSTDKVKMEWKEKVVKEMAEAGIENLGRLSQKECAKLYSKGRILAYPSEFYEIDCITIKKAQACGCMPITTDFAAFKESNWNGKMVHSLKTTDNWNRPYQFHFGIEDPKFQDQWVDLVVAELLRDMNPKTVDLIKDGMLRFKWEEVSKEWSILLR